MSSYYFFNNKHSPESTHKEIQSARDSGWQRFQFTIGIQSDFSSTDNLHSAGEGGPTPPSHLVKFQCRSLPLVVERNVIKSPTPPSPQSTPTMPTGYQKSPQLNCSTSCNFAQFHGDNLRHNGRPQLTSSTSSTMAERLSCRLPPHRFFDAPSHHWSPSPTPASRRVSSTPAYSVNLFVAGYELTFDFRAIKVKGDSSFVKILFLVKCYIKIVSPCKRR